jgi:GT2 family glycosyltransferase
MLGCSVIVVTHNSSAPIEACLRALASQGCEIVVVDNASEDDTVARVRALAGELTLQLIAVSRNIGFAGGVNHGVAAASGNVLLLLNPDAMAEAGAIEAILSAFERWGADAVGGALLDDNGQPARGFTFRRLPTPSALLCEVLLINQLWPGNPVNRRYRCLDAELTREQDVQQPAGACLAVRREVWDRLHGMDAGFFPVWFEDVDFCARLEESGAKTVYCPAARFRHSGAHSVGQLAFRDKQRFWYGNMLRYAGKHFSMAQVAVLRAGIVLGVCARMVASLVGGGPQVVRRSEAVRAYAAVALLAVGIGGTN